MNYINNLVESYNSFMECYNNFMTYKGEDIMVTTDIFGPSEWEKYHFKLENYPEIPSEILSYLEMPCPFWTDKLVKQTHFLCLIPSGLNMKTIYELSKQKPSGIFVLTNDQISNDTHWILITKKAIPDIYKKNYQDQNKMLTNYGYRMPHITEAAIAIICAKKLNLKMYSYCGTLVKSEKNKLITVGSDQNAFFVTKDYFDDRLESAGIYSPKLSDILD